MALWTVVGYHAYRIVLAGPAELDVDVPLWAWPLGVAKFAIDVFFVLSGFLVVASWDALRRRAASSGAAVRAYAARRALRVLPAWWLSLVVLVPLVAPELLSPRRWGDLALFALAQQYLVPGLASTLNTPSWSLTVELQFYAVAPLVALGLRRFGRLPLAAATLGVSVLWWLWLRHHVGLPPSSLPGRIDQFALGAIAGSIALDHVKGHHRRVVAFTRRPLVIAGCCLTLLALGVHHGSTLGVAGGSLVDALLHPIASVLVAMLLVAVLTADRPTPLDTAVPRACGLVSFSAYLWHYPLLLAVLRWSGRAGTARFDVVTAAILAGYVLVLAAIAVASYTLVERPFLRRRSSPASSMDAAAATEAARAPALSG